MFQVGVTCNMTSNPNTLTARFDTEPAGGCTTVKLYINDVLFTYDTIDPSWPFYDTRMAMLKKRLLSRMTDKLYRFGYLMLTDPPK